MYRMRIQDDDSPEKLLLEPDNYHMFRAYSTELANISDVKLRTVKKQQMFGVVNAKSYDRRTKSYVSEPFVFVSRFKLELLSAFKPPTEFIGAYVIIFPGPRVSGSSSLVFIAFFDAILDEINAVRATSLGKIYRNKADRCFEKLSHTIARVHNNESFNELAQEKPK